MEAAASAAERGHSVRVLEEADHLGGQLEIAARMPGQSPFADYVRFQARLLAAAGVTIELGHRALAAEVAGAGADAVVVATGAQTHRPDVPGIDNSTVLDARAILLEQFVAAESTVIVVEDDHMMPSASPTSWPSAVTA